MRAMAQLRSECVSNVFQAYQISGSVPHVMVRQATNAAHSHSLPLSTLHEVALEARVVRHLTAQLTVAYYCGSCPYLKVLVDGGPRSFNRVYHYISIARRSEHHAGYCKCWLQSGSVDCKAFFFYTSMDLGVCH